VLSTDSTRRQTNGLGGSIFGMWAFWVGTPWTVQHYMSPPRLSLLDSIFYGVQLKCFQNNISASKQVSCEAYAVYGFNAFESCGICLDTMAK
jgi:hypothetical protein